MDFEALQERVLSLLELGGYQNTDRPPVPGALVMKAYREFVWETECNWEEDDTTVTVIDQPEYDFPARPFKFITEAYYDETPLQRISPYMLRAKYQGWLKAASDTPFGYFRTKPRTFRLFYTPAEADVAITLYGPRMPVDLADPTDEPIVPEPYHEALAKRAYWIEAERFARDDERQALLDQVDQYLKMLGGLKREFGGDRLIGATRSKQVPQPDWVAV